MCCKVRRGVQPGSFIDLLMRAKDKTTGQGFTDLEIANQVASLLPHLSLQIHHAPVPALLQNLGLLLVILFHSADSRPCRASRWRLQRCPSSISEGT